MIQKYLRKMYIALGTFSVLTFVVTYLRIASQIQGRGTFSSQDAVKSEESHNPDNREEVNRGTIPHKVEQWRINTPQLWSHTYMGKVNLHAFEEWCGNSIAELRKNRRYPLHPHVRTTVSELAVAPQKTDFGVRIFGYIHPYTDGNFVFALSSHMNSEFWLSTDESPLNVKLLAYVGKVARQDAFPNEHSLKLPLQSGSMYFMPNTTPCIYLPEAVDVKTGAEWTAPGEFQKFSSQISKPLWLSEQKKYFFEVLHKQNNKGFTHVEVAWQLQDQDPVFKVIDSKHISLYVDESTLLLGDILHIPETLASHSQSYTEQHIDMARVDHRDTLYRVPLMTSTLLENVLPNCSYKPTYAVKGQPVNRYQGIEFISLSYVYPNDYTRLTHVEAEDSCFYSKFDLRQYTELAQKTPKWDQNFSIGNVEFHTQWSHNHKYTDCNTVGNLLLNTNDVLPVVQAFLDQINKKQQESYSLVHVVNVVKHIDPKRGSRYLLELKLTDKGGQVLRLSHYIYRVNVEQSGDSPDSLQPNAEPQLCNPVNFRLNMAATVHIIVPVKNQAAWVHLLIADMERMYKDTGDDNFNLIICDYNSTDMNVEAALKKSSLPRYDFIRLTGNFQRSAGLQAGINLIKDSHSIVFLFDLHIQFSSSLVDSIRKHCVEGYMVFTPIVMRLDCGSAGYEAKGFWEVWGYGLLGIYKSDIDTVGGMNTIEFKDRWGGEDWELIDRIVKSGLEVDRIYLRNLVHYYHSKRGMWNNPSRR